MILKKISTSTDLKNELKNIGAEQSGITIMQPKFEHYIIKIKNIKTPAALILKQEILSKGGEAAIPKEMIVSKINKGNVLLSANKAQYIKLCKKLDLQPFGLKDISAGIKSIISPAKLKPIKINNHIFDFNKTYIMGILNATPDSFSDGGKYIDAQTAFFKVKKMITEGADIIDIGGQSTRPGAEKISAEEELKRILPVLKEIKTNTDIVVSIDTFYSEVAEKCLKEGADIINDISGLRFDPKMPEVIAKYNCPVIIMHIKGSPENMQNDPQYKDTLEEVIDYLQESIAIALENGIKHEQLIVDPGIGFGKTVNDNYKILRNLNEIEILGCPILIGTSRKSLIGKILNDPVDKRLEGSIATNVAAIMNGANIIRVHDVAELKKAALITDQIRYFN